VRTWYPRCVAPASLALPPHPPPLPTRSSARSPLCKEKATLSKCCWRRPILSPHEPRPSLRTRSRHESSPPDWLSCAIEWKAQPPVPVRTPLGLTVNAQPVSQKCLQCPD
jgi:hypothetical protein